MIWFILIGVAFASCGDDLEKYATRAARLELQKTLGTGVKDIGTTLTYSFDADTAMISADYVMRRDGRRWERDYLVRETPRGYDASPAGPAVPSRLPDSRARLRRQAVQAFTTDVAPRLFDVDTTLAVEVLPDSDESAFVLVESRSNRPNDRPLHHLVRLEKGKLTAAYSGTSWKPGWASEATTLEIDRHLRAAARDGRPLAEVDDAYAFPKRIYGEKSEYLVVVKLHDGTALAFDVDMRAARLLAITPH